MRWKRHLTASREIWLGLAERALLLTSAVFLPPEPLGGEKSMKCDLQENEAAAIDWKSEVARPQAAAESSSAEPIGSRVGKGSEIIGTIVFEGSVVIDGKLEGNIEGPGKITVGENGSVITTRLTTDSIVIGGSVKVKSIASRRIEILPTGKVWGDLASPSLLVHEGAQFVGKAFARAAQQESEAPERRTRSGTGVRGQRSVTTAQGE